MGKGYSIDVAKKKCVTPVCRGSYVNILEARPLPESEKMAWGLQLLFPKSDPEVEQWRNEMSGLYAQVLIDKFGKEEAIKLASSTKTPLRDGDDPSEADKELQGFWFMNSNNVFRQPHIIGPAGKPLTMDEISKLTVDDLYSGAWYRCMLEYWYYNKSGNKGISSSVAAIMKVRDDENLGSGTTKTEAAEGFSAFASEAAGLALGDTAGEEPDSDATAKAGEEAEKFDFL